MNLLAQFLQLPFTISAFVMGGFLDPIETQKKVNKAFASPIDEWMREQTARYIANEETEKEKSNRSTEYWQNEYKRNHNNE